MELQHFQVHFFLIVGIVLSCLAGSGSCKDTFAFTEVRNCRSNSDANNPSSKALHCVQGYITESYFEKYDRLVDSDFQDFLACEVPLGVCGPLQGKVNSVPKLSLLHRHLIGEGSHRRLSSSIQFIFHRESNTELPDHRCEAIIIERLPSGVFADPFELQHLLRRGVFTEASAFGDTNLELPSFQSNRSIVEIHMDIGLNILSGDESGLEINIELPLHARYPRLGDHGFSRIEFGLPDLFTRCNVEGLPHNQSCLFMDTNGTAESVIGRVVWEVPCGKKEHAAAVSFVTFMAAIVSAILIVTTSVYYSDTSCNNLKQS